MPRISSTLFLVGIQIGTETNMLDSAFGRERLRATRRLARRGDIGVRFLVLAWAYGCSLHSFEEPNIVDFIGIPEYDD